MEKISKDKSSQLPDFNLPNKLLKLEEELELVLLEKLLLKKMLLKNSPKVHQVDHMPVKPKEKALLILKDLKYLFLEEDFQNYSDQERTENDSVSYLKIIFIFIN